MRAERLPEGSRGGALSRHFDTHVVVIVHARWGSRGWRCRAVTEVEVQVDVVVLGANSVGGSEIETILRVVEFELEISVAESDISRACDVLTTGLNVSGLEVRGIPSTG